MLNQCELNLPFRVLNLTDFYQNHVVAPMVEGYAAGITLIQISYVIVK